MSMWRYLTAVVIYCFGGVSLKADDATFNAGTGANGVVRALAIQADDAVLIGGEFTEFNGQPRAGIARTSRDGQLDAAFAVSSQLLTSVHAIAVQADGRILLGSTNAGPQGAYVVRVNSDGSTDGSFVATVNGPVHAVALGTNGSIWLGGDFTEVNGVPRNRIARMDASGAVDLNFDPGAGADGTVFALLPDSDGGVLLGGVFSMLGTNAVGRLARLAHDGSLDGSFYAKRIPSVSGYAVRCIARLDDGNLIVGGKFSLVESGQMNIHGIIRLLPTGREDLAFTWPAYRAASGTTGVVHAVTVEPRGRMIVAGDFQSFNDRPRPNLVRLSPDGATDTCFISSSYGAPNGVVFTLAQQTADRVVVGGGFTRVSTELRGGVARFVGGEPPPVGPSVTLVPVSGWPRVGMFGTTVFDTLVESCHGRLAYQWYRNGLPLVGDRYPYISGTGSQLGVSHVLNSEPLPGDYFVTVSNFVGMATSAVVHVDVGSVNSYFNITNGPLGWTESPAISAVLSVMPMEDGGVLAGGRFTQAEGASWPHLARFHDDGSLDRTFTARPNRPVYSMLRQPDGRILIAGEFNAVNGLFRDRVARLEADGTLDANFQTRLGLNGTIRSLALQQDGKILVAGVFSIPLPGGGYMHHLARLETNGAVDFSFNTGTNLYGADTTLHFAQSVLVLDDGRILVGGSFHRSVGGTRDYLARFLPDGTLDPAYGTAPLLGPSGPVSSLALAPGGPIYVGGSFTNFNGVGITNLARLLPDGTWDESYRPQGGALSRPVHALATDSGGNVFALSGDLSINMARSSILKFDSNGRRQTNYVGPELPTATRDGIHCLALLSDGGMFIGGNFDFVDRQSSRRLARLLGPLADAPEVVALSPSQTIEGGRSFLLGATVAGNSTPTPVQWVLNGAIVPGETNVFLIRSEADSSMAGEYRLVASNQFGMSTSAVATVTVRPAGRPGSVAHEFQSIPGPASGGVIALAESVNGKVFVGGSFSNYHGIARVGTARINADGSLDFSFEPQESRSTWSYTSALLPLPNGSVVVAGEPYLNGYQVRRFQTNGAFDPNWRFDAFLSPYSPISASHGSRYRVSDLAADAQGRIYLGGGFSGVRLGNGSSLPIRYTMRLFENGTADTSYLVRLPGTGFADAILAMGLDGDGNVQLGTHPGDSQFGLYRLNSQGRDDGTPRLGPWSRIDVWSLLMDAQGRTLFTCDPWSEGTNFQHGLGRRLSSGEFDSSFRASRLPNGYQYDRVLGVQQDGRILVAIWNYDSGFPAVAVPWRSTTGGISYYGERFNTNRLVRLNPDGSLDTSFDVGDGPNGYIGSALIRSDGNILVGGRFSRFSGFYCNNIALLHGGSSQPPSVLQSAESKTVVAGEVLHLSALVEGFPPPQLQWLKNGVAIPGATRQSYHVRVAAMDDAGVYSLVASNASGVSTSIVATVSVRAGRLNSDWVDSGFSADSEPNGEVHVIVPQPDGRILIGGQFTRVGNVPRPGIARLLADGSLDGGFNTSTNFADYSVEGSVTVSQIVLLPDGKVAVGRSFSQIYGSRQNATLRLHEDGRVDTSFTNLANRIPLLTMPDGRLLVGRGAPALQMLAPDGTVDNSFVAATNLGVFISQASLLADGRILISPEGSGTLERLMPDGSRDESFAQHAANLNSDSSSDICFPNPGGAIPSAYVLAHAVQPDGKILIGGVFSKYLNRYTANLIRLLPSGEIDSGFNAWGYSDYAVRAVAVQSDGKILIGGCFTYAGLGAARLHLARLHPDGSTDSLFDPGPTLRGTSSGHVRAMALQSDGRLLIGGMFDSVNGATRRNLARLNGELVMFQTASGDAEFSTRVATVEGRTYFLELRASLDDGNWVVVDSAVGTGEAVRLTHSSQVGETRYYRVRAE